MCAMTWASSYEQNLKTQKGILSHLGAVLPKFRSIYSTLYANSGRKATLPAVDKVLWKRLLYFILLFSLNEIPANHLFTFSTPDGRYWVLLLALQRRKELFISSALHIACTMACVSLQRRFRTLPAIILFVLQASTFSSSKNWLASAAYYGYSTGF